MWGVCVVRVGQEVPDAEGKTVDGEYVERLTERVMHTTGSPHDPKPARMGRANAGRGGRCGFRRALL